MAVERVWNDKEGIENNGISLATKERNLDRCLARYRVAVSLTEEAFVSLSSIDTGAVPGGKIGWKS